MLRSVDQCQAVSSLIIITPILHGSFQADGPWHPLPESSTLPDEWTREHQSKTWFQNKL
ncbi:hypothetical protein PAHAL_8G054700 [Panicum hallii]|uniref:Uncharacterized protein n=1 Tax=Panicum hallii TaxID=206008 RepID=A0A2T8I7U6_9POAL|nr:hypothetical protein PAHAL_8G054700 [Panicum hallii]